jgi:hypothetical protein
VVRTSSDLADALVAVAESFLAGQVAGADDPEIYQVMVHVGTGALDAAEPGNVSAETPGPADPARCRFPGCQSRRVDLHHIVYWANGGRTDLANLISLCRYHHTLVHERGYLIAPSAPPGAGFVFCRPDGSLLPACPALPQPDGTIDDTHDADITPETIIPPWYGERLDLDHAIYVCFANARTQQERQQQGDQAGQPEAQRRVTIYEPEDWPERIRQYYAEHPAGPRRPVQVPIQLRG